MRKYLVLFGLVLLAAGSAMAQEGPSFEVSGNYNFIRMNPGGSAPGQNCQGFGGTAAINANAWLGILGDFGGCKITGLPAGTSSSAWTYLFGPRIYLAGHSRVSPYAQVLFGGERASVTITGLPSTSTSSFAWTFGGGFDFRATKHISVRPFQLEYLYTKFSSTGHENNLRIQSGIVYRFGR
jgi:opacity protein-like surface antigen